METTGPGHRTLRRCREDKAPLYHSFLAGFEELCEGNPCSMRERGMKELDIQGQIKLVQTSQQEVAEETFI